MLLGPCRASQSVLDDLAAQIQMVNLPDDHCPSTYTEAISSVVEQTQLPPRTSPEPPQHKIWDGTAPAPHDPPRDDRRAPPAVCPVETRAAHVLPPPVPQYRYARAVPAAACPPLPAAACPVECIPRPRTGPYEMCGCDAADNEVSEGNPSEPATDADPSLNPDPNVGTVGDDVTPAPNRADPSNLNLDAQQATPRSVEARTPSDDNFKVPGECKDKVHAKSRGVHWDYETIFDWQRDENDPIRFQKKVYHPKKCNTRRSVQLRNGHLGIRAHTMCSFDTEDVQYNVVNVEWDKAEEECVPVTRAIPLSSEQSNDMANTQFDVDLETLGAGATGLAGALALATVVGPKCGKLFRWCRNKEPEQEVDSGEMPSFSCPITSERFKDPVVTVDGHTYERAAIDKWFAEGHRRGPSSNQQLATTNVIPNWALKNAIDEYAALSAEKLKKPERQSLPLRRKQKKKRRRRGRGQRRRGRH